MSIDTLTARLVDAEPSDPDDLDDLLESAAEHLARAQKAIEVLAPLIKKGATYDPDEDIWCLRGKKILLPSNEEGEPVDLDDEITEALDYIRDASSEWHKIEKQYYEFNALQLKLTREIEKVLSTSRAALKARAVTLRTLRVATRRLQRRWKRL